MRLGIIVSGMADNAGAQRLRKLGLKQADVAAAVGTDQSVVSRWERGDRKPATPARIKLEEVYGIDWRSWDLEPEPEPDAPEAPAAAEQANGSVA